MSAEFEVRDLRKRDKFSIDDTYIDAQAKICGIYSTGVYASLCRHASQYQECYPSMRLIAAELGISEKQVGRALRSLEVHNVIRTKRVGKKLNNRYYLLDKSEWTASPVTDRTTSPVTPDPQSNHYRTDSPIHSKVTATVKGTHINVPPAEAGEGGFAHPKGKGRKKYTPEHFNFLKDYQLRTWKLSGGEYPWGKVDAGMISRLLNSYELATCMALLDLFWAEIRKFNNDWVLKQMGRNAKGLLYMLPRLMDMAELKIRAEKHQRALAEATPGTDMAAAATLARTLGAALQRVPGGPDYDAQRRQAVQRSEEAARKHPEAA